MHARLGVPVLAFPSNEWRQEPDPDATTKAYVHSTFGITPGFELFAKTEVNGPRAHPVFQALRRALPRGLRAGRVGGNFNEWLVDERGMPVQHIPKKVAPSALEPMLREVLARLHQPQPQP